jgi:hypothetical protein
VGNNAFSYNDRINKQIFVPALIEENIADISIGEEIVFSEIEGDIEYNRTGLKDFIYNYHKGKHIFVFDNHNHAFFFWMIGFLNNFLETDSFLVHIDQHSDMREPFEFFSESLTKNIGIDSIFKYTNNVLNVGNFIKPALNLGLFSKVDIIDSSYSFEYPIPTQKYILDIDMDIFSDDMSYIAENLKFDKIKQYIKSSNFITIATSPYFIEQKKAVDLIKQLFQ